MADHGQDEANALEAADRWLALIDRGDAAASWVEAADLFRAAVDEARWVESLRRAQEPLGRPVERKLRSMNYTTELPGAPDGEYVVLEYDTRFQRKRRGTETVVMMKEHGEEWRASGYHVR